MAESETSNSEDNSNSSNNNNNSNNNYDLNIARRTRSHLRIDDFVPNDNLDFPDVDKNLYNNPDSVGDPVYRNFLAEIYSFAETTNTDTNTDDNDPAYVYNDDIFSHGWKFSLEEALPQDDNETTTSPNNFNFFQQNAKSQQGATIQSTQIDQQQLTTVDSLSTRPEFRSPTNSNRRKIDMFDEPEFARILNQQLRQHIQLLTQTYLLTKNTTNMRQEADEAKSHLNAYMKIFKNKRKPSNLLPAMELVNNLSTPKDIKSSIRLSWRPLPIPESVKITIKNNPHVFIYPSLLPQVAFSFLPEKLIPKKPKINFTSNEDKLLAYALNEFKGETSQYAFIALLLMTAKTKTQISNHIKNIKRSSGNEDNPIKLYFSHGYLPTIDLDSDASLREDISVKEISFKSDVDSDDNRHREEVSVGEMEMTLTTVREEKGSEVVAAITDDRYDHHSSGDEKEKDRETAEHVDLEPQSPSQTPTAQSQKEIYRSEEEHLEETPQLPPPDTSLAIASPQSIDQSSSITFKDDHDDIMNMDLDDLMAASTTISKSATNNPNLTNSNNNGNGTNSSENSKNIKNLKLKQSMLNLMSHKFLLSQDMGDMIVYQFLKVSQNSLSERNFLHLLQLLTDLMKKQTKQEINDQMIIPLYESISKFLTKINAPPELHEKLVLFLNLDQATKCGCALSYLHWMRFFEFMQHVELCHDADGFEKKLIRLVDALQRDDPHKVKLATASLVNKNPLLKRELESLSLDGKPHPSLFICDEDFDDITEPISAHKDSNEEENCVGKQDESIYKYEHFNFKPTKEEISYASQSCPCRCHPEQMLPDNQPGQHCSKCNLKFMKGRMFLVHKIKPILAEWSYTSTLEMSMKTAAAAASSQPNEIQTKAPVEHHSKWTFEEDKEILEFCRIKAEQNEETVSFDTTTFEELVNKRRALSGSGGGNCKKSAREIAERFNQLMEMYRDENSNALV